MNIIEKLRALIKMQIRREELNFASLGGGGQTMNIGALEWVLKQLDTIGEKSEKPINHVLQDFPTTEKEMQDFLATHERIPVPERLNSLERILQEQPVMIEWTGNNLKEVIEFTGKSPRFDEWFKTWDEYESYVHSHGNIFKLFNEDGTHLEVPVGAWIFKTPDGRNVPSTFLYQEQPVCEGLEEEIKRYYEDMDGDCRYVQTARHFAQWGAEHLKK